MRYVLAIAVFYVLGLNACVRSHGGDAHLLSLTRLPEKTHAVLKLGLHAMTHAFSDHCERERAAELVAEAARARDIPVRFALAIARTESGFRSHSISSTGAMGLMQLMPQTARSFGVGDPFDPADNARGSLAFIQTLWQRYKGDRRRVAAAYNAGPARVARRGKLDLPAETRAYTLRVAKYEREPDALPRLPLQVARR